MTFFGTSFWKYLLGSENRWPELAQHIRDLFGIKLSRPIYTPAQPYIFCEYRDPGCRRPFDLSNAGSSTLQVILLLAFLYVRPASVILLDEPDAHQHVPLQQTVYDLIQDIARHRNTQIILATHSQTILNATPSDQILEFSGDMP